MVNMTIPLIVPYDRYLLSSRGFDNTNSFFSLNFKCIKSDPRCSLSKYKCSIEGSRNAIISIGILPFKGSTLILVRSKRSETSGISLYYLFFAIMILISSGKNFSLLFLSIRSSLSSKSKSCLRVIALLDFLTHNLSAAIL